MQYPPWNWSIPCDVSQCIQVSKSSFISWLVNTYFHHILVWLVWYHRPLNMWVALGYCLEQQSYQLVSSLYKRYWLKLRSRFICLCSVKEDPFLARVVLCDLLKPTFVLFFESDWFGAKMICDMLLSSINWWHCIGRVSNFEGNFRNLPVHWHLGCSRKLSNWQCKLIAYFTSIRAKSQVCDLWSQIFCLCRVKEDSFKARVLWFRQTDSLSM